MRSHQMFASCGLATSPGWRRWICGHDARNAATGASKRPTPSEIGSRTGRCASAPIKIAPATATHVMTSMPSTQPTVAVDLATVGVRRRTRTADMKRPPPMLSLARSHSAAGPWEVSKAASGPRRRPSGDTYRISRPHQACEVVAAADHVQVDVLTQVEAWVLVWAAKARGVDVEDDQARPAAPHGLQQLHPRWVGARSDDGDRPPR